MSLADERLNKLVALIQDSFRVRPNQDPVYVDIGGHLSRIAAPQIQVVFGRRGSGKSCLLVHFHKNASKHDAYSIYVDADEIKTLSYPDLLIRLLISILSGFPGAKKVWWQKLLRRSNGMSDKISELRDLLDKAEHSDVTQADGSVSTTTFQGTASKGPLTIGRSKNRERSSERTATFTEDKKQFLERHLQDYKDALKVGLAATRRKMTAVIVDDFYLVHPPVQPDVIDYLHRLTRGTDAYLKIGTIRHRTSLVRYDDGQTIGVEPTQDVESIDLDQTFEDTEKTKSYLSALLDSLGREVEIESASTEYLSPEGLFALTLASGGVPRDYLTTFVEAVDWARSEPRFTRVTPKAVYKGAARISYRTKLVNLRSDAGPDAARLEAVFQDLLKFCLVEKKKTAFLISQEDAVANDQEHDLIKQLMDFKLTHVIEPDTSAASGRAGRFEAYTLDFVLFMEPRKRGIELVEFWLTDENRRREGLRESPDYPLARVFSAISAGSAANTETLVEQLDQELGFEE